MNLDLRIPIGILFSALGLILGGYGLATNGSDIYARSLSININLWWGAVLLLFGIGMLIFGLRKK
jgi:hypothetical protein